VGGNQGGQGFLRYTLVCGIARFGAKDRIQSFRFDQVVMNRVVLLLWLCDIASSSSEENRELRNEFVSMDEFGKNSA